MRILSLHPNTTELVFALGAGNLLVGRTDECDFPSSALCVPSIGSGAEVTGEMTAVFQPDVILLGEGQDHLRHMGVNVILVAPKSLQELFECIVSLGGRLGKQVEADVITNDLASTMEKIKERMPLFARVSVYVEAQQQTISAGLLQDLVLLAGGDPYRGRFEINAVQSFNPQLIIAVNDNEQSLQHIIARPLWTELQAVRHERVFWMHPGVLRPTPRLADGVRHFAKLTHGVEILTQN